MKQLENIQINSEVGKLEGVILHTPGSEVENMTPMNAQRALYSDILNLDIAKWEHSQLSDILNKVSKTYEVKNLLLNVLNNDKAKQILLTTICKNENVQYLYDDLNELDNIQLSNLLIEGYPIKRDTLTNFSSKERFSLTPLYNFYFTRDASISIRNDVLISKMASNVRVRETMIMESIFNYSGVFQTSTINPSWFNPSPEITIEGGDVLIAREDILVIGKSIRTTTQGIDFILKRLLSQREDRKRYILVQELPNSPESFIHLDMVFTFLSHHECMVFEPIILKENKYQTIQITIDNGKVESIKYVPNLLVALKNLGMDLKPIFCGGTKDLWVQEREQWHSGANFFAFAPGKIIGYGRNLYTLDELCYNNYQIINSCDVISEKIDLNKIDKCVVTLEGSELPRGGGGARCMTMPIRRN